MKADYAHNMCYTFMGQCLVWCFVENWGAAAFTGLLSIAMLAIHLCFRNSDD